MSELFSKLGIDWKLLLAQAANFLILLAILKITVYKPLLNLLKTRREKIEKGLEDATLSGERLKEADLMKRDKLAEADRTSLAIIKESEKKAKELEVKLLNEAKKKEADILLQAKIEAERETQEERSRFFEEAATLVKQAVVRVVESSPKEIDGKLINEVVSKMKRAG